MHCLCNKSWIFLYSGKALWAECHCFSYRNGQTNQILGWLLIEQVVEMWTRDLLNQVLIFHCPSTSAWVDREYAMRPNSERTVEIIYWGTNILVLLVRCLPCTQSTCVWSPVSHAVPQTLPGMIPSTEPRVSPKLCLVQARKLENKKTRK